MSDIHHQRLAAKEWAEARRAVLAAVAEGIKPEQIDRLARAEAALQKVALA
jgi:hypothetical protein